MSKWFTAESINYYLFILGALGLVVGFIFVLKKLRNENRLKENKWSYLIPSIVTILLLFADFNDADMTLVLVTGLMLIFSAQFLLHQVLTDKYQELECIAPYYTLTREMLRQKMGDLRDKVNCKRSLDLYDQKLESLCGQVGNGTFFLSEKVFKKTWSKLINASSSYYSICDLSIYANIILDDITFESEKDDWGHRIEEEFKALGQNQNLLSNFKKILVFDLIKHNVSEQYVCQDDSSPKCDFGNCNNHRCIVKFVATKWKEKISSGDFSNKICLAYKDNIVNSLHVINNTIDDLSSREKITSIDIGIFNEQYIGEEYKYKIDILGFKEEKRYRQVEYLYRFNDNEQAAKRIVQKFNQDIFI